MSFHQGSNAQVEELVPRSNLQQPIGRRGAGGERRQGRAAGRLPLGWDFDLT